MNSNNPKLITIVGPTASGKTELAVTLAERFNGEIVCADSRTIYRGMDIGTAKPTGEERSRVRHHLLDIVEPDETLSVAAYKMLAEHALADIAARGSQPFLVGGSGLYIDALMFDYQFAPPADPARRAELEAMEDGELLELLAAEDPAAYERVDRRNRRRVVRAIETAGQAISKRQELRPATLMLGLGLNKEIVHKRIRLRIEKSLKAGIIDEVRQVSERYGWNHEAMSGNAYRAFRGVVEGVKTVEEAIGDNVRADLMLYKKQLTWFKRNKSIQWLADPAEAVPLVERFLRRPV